MRMVVLTSLLAMVLWSCSVSEQPEGLELLSEMRKGLGLPETIEGFSIYTLADCKGPDSGFTTLVASDAENARFEQVSGEWHMIGFHNQEQAFWYDVNADEESQADSAAITFMIDHELHMLAYFPESRFGPPTAQKDTTFHSKPAIQLLFIDLLDKPVRIYYEQKNLRPIGYTVYNHTPRGEPWIDVLFDNWKEVKSHQAFTAARFLHGSEVFVYEYTEIQFESLPEGVFTNREAFIN